MDAIGCYDVAQLNLFIVLAGDKVINCESANGESTLMTVAKAVVDLLIRD